MQAWPHAGKMPDGDRQILPDPSPDLEELQEHGLGETGLLDHGHCIGEVIHVIAVHIQHHRLGKLGTRANNQTDRREGKVRASVSLPST